MIRRAVGCQNGTFRAIQSLSVTETPVKPLPGASFNVCFFSTETDKNDKPEESKEATFSGISQETEGDSSDAGESPEEKLQKEVKELKDQLLRSLAEQENTRRIAQRDIDSARQFAIQSFAKSLLEVSDNLTLALQSIPGDDEAKNNAPLQSLAQGIEMTEKGLLKAFEKNGLVRYGEPGDEFDPNKHEALYEYEDAEKTAGSIGQVMKAGFLLHERVLRPAEVGVVKGV